MSQKLSFLLLVFGLIWGLMLLHYTLQQPRRQSSVKLREQILDLSKRYVKALAEESRSTADVDNGASMAGYGKNCTVSPVSFPARSCINTLTGVELSSHRALYKLIKKKLQVNIFKWKVEIVLIYPFISLKYVCIRYIMCI